MAVPNTNSEPVAPVAAGMTKREYVAALIMAQLAPHAAYGSERDCTCRAVDLADALLERLAQKS